MSWSRSSSSLSSVSAVCERRKVRWKLPQKHKIYNLLFCKREFFPFRQFPSNNVYFVYWNLKKMHNHFYLEISKNKVYCISSNHLEKLGKVVLNFSRMLPRLPLTGIVKCTKEPKHTDNAINKTANETLSCKEQTRKAFVMLRQTCSVHLVSLDC